MNAITTVPFHNHNLLLITHNERPYVAMKPIVEGMGLAWTSQREKINANSKRWAVELLSSPTEKDGKTYDMISMPLLKLPAFMASVHPSRVKKELRPSIEMYQEECDDVLADYWFKGQATNPRATISPAQQHIIAEKVKELAADNKAYPKYYGALKRHFKIAKYDQLLSSDFEEALEVLQGVVVGAKAIEDEPVPSDMIMVNKKDFIALTQLAEAASETYSSRIQELEIMVTDASIKLVEFRSRTWDKVRDAGWIAKMMSKDIQKLN